MAETLITYSKRKTLWKRILVIAGSLLIVSVLCLTSFLIFNKYYYTPFWVNGQSMYPTFNRDAKDASGNLLGEYGGSARVDCYDIDYGFMDEHQSAIDSIKRFDIVVCKYPNSDSSYKIKRIIATPNETFYINNTDSKGSLYVLNSSDTFEIITQPIDEAMIKKGSYPNDYASPTTLKEDEYFVLGDNRANSYDSRNVGPIKKEYIVGVVRGLSGRAKIGMEDGELKPVYISYYFPRYL